MTSSEPAVDVLRRRIDALDHGLVPTVPIKTDRPLVHSISVMRRYMDTLGQAAPLVVGPKEADDVVATSQLIGTIAQHEPSLVVGPLSASRQHWIGTGRHAMPDGDVPTPARTLFVAPDHIAGGAPNTKPFGLGLFTSTAAASGNSMWRLYLDMFRASILTPRPWYTWKVELPDKGVSVLEIASAVGWTEFVAEYARVGPGPMVYPNWSAVARDFDGVHMTMAAIVAIQAFSFPSSRGVTAPAFWDVEQTLWLRWVFGSVCLVEVTHVSI